MYCEEVVDLHRFIRDWMAGAVPKTEEVFSRFADALDPEFVIVHPSGLSESRPELIESFRAAHGIRDRSFRIEIRNMKRRIECGSFVLVTYEEWQYWTTATGRISTVLFRKAEDASSIRWVHLHETWISSGEVGPPHVEAHRRIGSR